MRYGHVVIGGLALFLLAARGGQDAEPAAVAEPAPEAAPEPSHEKKKQAEIERLLAEADQLYNKRSPKFKINGNARASYDKAKQALDLDAGSYEACWRVARAAFWIADGTQDKKIKEEWGKKGWDAAKQGTRLNSKRIEAQFWGAASLANYAKGSGIMKAIWDGLGTQFEEWVTRSVKIDRTYMNGSPVRALGRYYFSIPGIAGGDNAKALKLILESKQIAPGIFRTRLYLAELYLDEGDKDKARAELEYCTTADPKKGDYIDNLRILPMCKALMKKL